VLAAVLPALALSLPLAAPGAAGPTPACAARDRLMPRVPAPAGGETGCAAALAEACDSGSPRACAALGEALEGSPGLPPDLERARALHARACRAELGDACERLARLLVAAGDREGALAAREHGCATGSALACAGLAATVADPVRARGTRERACDLGDGPSCLALAAGGGPRAGAFQARACALGDGDACAAVAEREDDLDPVGARHRLERGCGLGSDLACARLGVVLLERGETGGRGAALLRDHCAALGVGPCLDAAARLLGRADAVTGDGAPPPLLEGACDRGGLDACARLGRLLQEGRRLPADGPRAAALYARACAGGVARACVDLGVLHRFGAGVPRDDRRARALLDRACDLGLEEGCFLRDDPVRPEGGGGAGDG
jgi:TPR repeat protein